MPKMGGLRHKMKITWMTFFVACLAIAGVPPLAGFISKDEILWQTFANHRTALWIMGVVTALMTAGYSFRALFMTFHGKSRLPEDVEHHVHESPWTMTLPLVILALGAIGAGCLNLPSLILGEGKTGTIDRFLEPIVGPAHEIITQHAILHPLHAPGLEWGLMLFSVLIAALGIFLAAFIVLWGYPQRGERVARKLGFLYRLSANRWWWDDLYNYAVVGTVSNVARGAVWFDRNIIDGVLHTVAALARGASGVMSLVQNGQVQAYALVVLAGVNVIVWLLLWF
jgi:NADH-quinone oxidoreductase subunit L